MVNAIRYRRGMDIWDIEPERIFRIPGEMYEQMVEAGMFDNRGRVELLEGVLVRRSPQDPPHARTIVRLTKLLVRLVGDRADVAAQVPFRASRNSLPEPDLALWPPDDDLAPLPERPLLVIEVADTSLRYDRGSKAPLYAAAGVPEYWLVNLNDDCVERFTRPAAVRYEQIETLHRGERLPLIAFPGLSLAVDDVLPRPNPVAP